MTFIADGHIHLYSSFQLDSLFLNAHRHLIQLGSAQSYLLFTVEPQGQFEFDKIPTRVTESIIVTKTSDQNVLKLKTQHGENLFVVAGRQIVSKERLEFLALFCREDIPDGLSIEELSKRVAAANAIFVLNWAPGKWMFSRSKIVDNLLKHFSPKKLLLCDTALRFYGWSEPKQMREARERGFKIIAGTDPFPIKGEEQRVGKYGFASLQDSDFREALFKGNLEVMGKRLLPHQTLWRVVLLAIINRFTPNTV